MLCPICEKPLLSAILHNVEVNYCPNCLGLWFKEDELRWAKDEEDKDLQWLDIDLWKEEAKFKVSRGIRLCPSCRVPLYEVCYGDSGNLPGLPVERAGGKWIIVDVGNLCRVIWLDRTEFKRIIEYRGQKED